MCVFPMFVSEESYSNRPLTAPELSQIRPAKCGPRTQRRRSVTSSCPRPERVGQLEWKLVAARWSAWRASCRPPSSRLIRNHWPPQPRTRIRTAPRPFAGLSRGPAAFDTSQRANWIGPIDHQLACATGRASYVDVDASECVVQMLPALLSLFKTGQATRFMPQETLSRFLSSWSPLGSRVRRLMVPPIRRSAHLVQSNVNKAALSCAG